ncbi:hypothetical protein EC973_009587 [Apophysomyces ossiformis]|uniref:Uncharacterized protein n=1 Tax=Apophysomyces ossiformis TaxID=679940 RepID=A0A8H7BQX6_9FUNG|nr:hypothetical protein EC973_009587 [Apophysomyces ossiformis]
MLGSSWAEVAKDDKTNTTTTQECETPVTHRPGAWEHEKEEATYADVTKHQDEETKEFPTPQEAAGITPSAEERDLSTSETDTTTPPNPERSFAEVASNKGFPALAESQPQDNDTPSSSGLSDIPDVKEMLATPSVHVPPPPASKSFSKVAAKTPPPREEPLSERAKAILENQPEPSALEFSHENFPTLSQVNLMQEAPENDRKMAAEIARMHDVAEAEKYDETKQRESEQQKTFADITSSNMENAPPSATPKPVESQLVYDEDTVLREYARREARKQKGKAVMEEAEVRPTEEQAEEAPVAEEDKETALSICFARFDRNKRGKITVWDTFLALRGQGYSWLYVVPVTIIMHLRLSPLTSPYRAPFLYRSLTDLLMLPIYTTYLPQALTYKTPMLKQDKDKITRMVQEFGHKDPALGLSFWDAHRAIKAYEKDTLRWWQLRQWFVLTIYNESTYIRFFVFSFDRIIHRLQWFLIYTMLRDPQTQLVTQPALINLGKSS